MEPSILLAAGLGGLAVVTLLGGLLMLVGRRRDPVLERLAAQSGEAAATGAEGTAAGGSLWTGLLGPLAKLTKPAEGADLSRIRARLAHGGYRSERAMELFFGAKLALGLLMASAALLLGRLLPDYESASRMGAVVAAAIGFYAPNLWLRHRVALRQRAISRSLPDALDLLVTCVEAGLGLEAALQRVATEIVLSSPELAAELRQTLLEIQAGSARAESFRRLSDRTGLEELRSLSVMLVQTEMFGTSIARSLRVHSGSLRTRRMHQAEEKGAVVSVKMLLPLIFCILPSLFVVVLGPAVVRMVQILLPTLSGERP